MREWGGVLRTNKRLWQRTEGPEVIIDGKRLVMIGSNNYLGLTTHPKVREAAINAIKEYGTGCTGSRFLNGTLDIHLELEEKLAKFVGKEKAIVFSTGFQTNIGTITSVIDKNGIIIADKQAHASIIDAIFLAKAQKRIKSRFFKHNDMKDLEKILSNYSRKDSKLVITDGVFSMEGDIAPLPGLIALCKKYNALLMVDEAHSLGVLSKGRGTAAHFDCVDDVDLIMGTFSKAFATVGGFIAGKKEVLHWIQHFARSFIFSASLPPANIATVLAVLEIIEKEKYYVERVNKISEMMITELKAMDYNIGSSQSAIVPIIIGYQFKVAQAWSLLFKSGIFTNVALPPAVPANLALLRTSYMATHTNEHIEKVLNTFKKLKKKLQTSRFQKNETL